MDSVKLALVLGFLFSLSETLAMIPQLKANSVFQMIQNIIAMLAGKTVKKD